MQFGSDSRLNEMNGVAASRNRVALFSYAVAVPAAWLHPAASLVIIFRVAALCFVPNPKRHVR